MRKTIITEDEKEGKEIQLVLGVCHFEKVWCFSKSRTNAIARFLSLRGNTNQATHRIQIHCQIKLYINLYLCIQTPVNFNSQNKCNM